MVVSYKVKSSINISQLPFSGIDFIKGRKLYRFWRISQIYLRKIYAVKKRTDFFIR
jgi:hypothetical protein